MISRKKRIDVYYDESGKKDGEKGCWRARLSNNHNIHDAGSTKEIVVSNLLVTLTSFGESGDIKDYDIVPIVKQIFHIHWEFVGLIMMFTEQVMSDRPDKEWDASELNPVKTDEDDLMVYVVTYEEVGVKSIFGPRLERVTKTIKIQYWDTDKPVLLSAVLY